MKTSAKRLVSSLLFMTLAAPVWAQNEKRGTELNLLVGGALEMGGDNIATVYFTNGEDQKVRTGQGGSIAVGGQLRFAGAEQLRLRATVGIKYLTTAAENVHIRLTRVPIITTANWMVTPKLRVGAGLAMHTGIRFKADGIGDDIRFNDAAGPILEVAYHGIGLSYTMMKYQDNQKEKYAANAIGLTLSGVINPKRK